MSNYESVFDNDSVRVKLADTEDGIALSLDFMEDGEPNAGTTLYLGQEQIDGVCAWLEKYRSVRPEELGITQNDKRWRILEHGCQWVSWTPTGGETHSFDPRDVKELKRMRAWADETIEKQLAILRDGIASLPSPQLRSQEKADG